MAVTLLSLSNGLLSLEFEPSDMSSVAAVIRARFGEVSSRPLPTATRYTFGGCSFLFQNEWDDPCLVSQCVEGSKLLKEIWAVLKADAP